MRRKFILALIVLMCVFCVPAYAVTGYITSYAFADIAGSISGTTIDVTVPYSTKTTYWNHKVSVSDGCTFRAGAITTVDDTLSTGIITVTSPDGSTTDYTVNIHKADFKGPTYSVGKAKSIKYNSAKVDVTVHYNDAYVSRVKLVYYTKKNSLSYVNVNGEGESTVELNGLREDTKYYYYLSVEAQDKTYETSAKTFRTKRKTDQGNTSSSNTSSSTQPSKGTSGPATEAKVNDVKKNQWSLENGKWYYYGADGYSKTGWFQVGDKWYYVTKGTNELAMGQWKEINNVWYFFDASGAMIANQWVKGDKGWYYMGDSGSMMRNQDITVNGITYVLDPSGVCLDNQMIYRDSRWLICKPNSGGIAKNEQVVYNGVTYNTDGSGYVY